MSGDNILGVCIWNEGLVFGLTKQWRQWLLQHKSHTRDKICVGWNQIPGNFWDGIKFLELVRPSNGGGGNSTKGFPEEKNAPSQAFKLNTRRRNHHHQSVTCIIYHHVDWHEHFPGQDNLYSLYKTSGAYDGFDWHFNWQHGQNCFYDDTGCVIDKSAGRHISTNFLDSMPPPLKGELARCLSGVSPLFTFFPPLLVRRSWWVVGVQLSRSNCSSKWLVSLSCGVENVHYVRTQGEEVFKRRPHSAANIYRSSNMDMIYVPGDWKKAFRSPGPQYSCIYTFTPGCMLPRRQARWGSQHQVTQRPTVKLNDCSGHSAAYNSRGGRVQIHRKSNHPKLYFYQDQPLFTYLVHKKQNDHQHSSFKVFLNSMSKSNFCPVIPQVVKNRNL